MTSSSVRPPSFTLIVVRKHALHVGLEIAHAFAAPSRVAGSARSEPAVRRRLAIADLVAVTVALPYARDLASKHPIRPRRFRQEAARPTRSNGRPLSA